MKLLVIDIETTGLEVKSDAIVEIGAALVDAKTKEIEVVFDKVVKDDKWNPSLHKNSWVFENSDLNFEDVEKAEPLSKYFDEIQGLLSTYDTVAFNLKFDEKFLTDRGFKFNKSKCLMESVKNYVVFENKNGRNVKPSVEEIYNYFLVGENEEVYIEKHRAASDAVDEAKIMLYMIDLKADKNYTKKVAKKSDKVKEKPKFKIKKTYDIVDVNSEFPFGKHKGVIFSNIVKKDKKYLQWCLENVGGLTLTEEAKKLLV
jgi:DNA polymerase III alpha subunit (gram-positive type)